MTWYRLFMVVFICACTILCRTGYCANSELTTYQGSSRIFPSSSVWSIHNRLPMTTAWNDDGYDYDEGRGKIKKKFKQFKKLLLPLLLAYKLKFFTLIPVLIGGLILLTGATGLAGFFFALFAAVMGLKSSGGHH